jgi:hypothetical protein
VEQDELVDEDRAQHEAPGGDQAAGGHPDAAVEAGFELAVPGLDGLRAQAV